MSITSVSSTSSTDALWWLEAIKNRSSQQTQGTSQTTSSQDAAANIKLSPMGQMMSKLESLSESDPDKFKELTLQISEKLKTAASKATGKDAEMLTEMADQFAKASESGDMSALRPPKPPDGAHDQSAPPPPTRGQDGGPSDDVRSVMDDIFQQALSI
jgi:hypothetical protein